MRYMGIDFGTKKVGIALSDEAGQMGFPYGIIPNDGRLIDEILALIERKEVGAVVMGESRDYAGNENKVAKHAKEFAMLLEQRSGMRAEFEPEMLTTQEARRDFEGVRVPGSPDVDASAAAIILTSYLSRTPMPEDQIEVKPEAAVAEEPATPHISIDEFAKIEVQVGTVMTAELVPETEKLLRLTVDFGEAKGPRQIVSGIRAYVSEPEELVGRQLAFVTNLAPRRIKGLESDGMLFAVGNAETFAFLTPDRPVPPGTSAH
jgi:putative transcription antitermination factor YqgF